MKFTFQTIRMKRTLALLAAAALLLPAALTGCMSADKLAERRAQTDEIGKKAEEYMKNKYHRGFKVKKCEFAEGEQYEGDFFVTFNNDIHAFYDTDEGKFYDDRQADAVNNEFTKVWKNMMDDIGLVTDNIIGTQDFNLIYEYVKGGELKKYSMYHDVFGGEIHKFAQEHYIAVRTEPQVLVSDSPSVQKIHDKIRTYINQYFKSKNTSAQFFIVTSAYHNSVGFDADNLDETVDGCLYSIRFNGNIVGDICRHQFLPVEGVEGLYFMLYGTQGEAYKAGDVKLVPVSDSDATAKAIKANMDGREMGLVDKYITKKRSVEFEQPIYRIEFSSDITYHPRDSYTLAFVMKDSEEEIVDYAPVKERERSFFAFDMNGDAFNATCLCSQNSRSTPFTFTRKGSDVYVWFGTQF